MSHRYRKIPYVTMGPYASTEKHYLLIHFNLTCDIVNVYEEDGTYLVSWDEWGSGKELDMGHALAKIAEYDEEYFEELTDEDYTKIK